MGETCGRAAAERSWPRSRTTLPPSFSEPVTSTWTEARDMLRDEAEGLHVKQSRVCWSFSLCPSRSTLHPSLPRWTTSPGLLCPLTSSWDLHKGASRILEWEKKAPFWIFLLLIPALCQWFWPWLYLSQLQRLSGMSHGSH